MKCFGLYRLKFPLISNPILSHTRPTFEHLSLYIQEHLSQSEAVCLSVAVCDMRFSLKLNYLFVCCRCWTPKGIFLQAASVGGQMGEVALLMHPGHQVGLWSNQVRWLFWDYWSRENDRTLGMTWGPTAYTETSSPPWVSSERGNVAICLKVFAWKFSFCSYRMDVPWVSQRA